MCDCSPADKSRISLKERQITPNSGRQSLDGFRAFLSRKWKCRADAFTELAAFNSCLDKREFTKLFQDYIDDDVELVFSLLDVKGDGLIRKVELKKLVRSSVDEEESPNEGVLGIRPTADRRSERRSTTDGLKADQEKGSPGGVPSPRGKSGNKASRNRQVSSPAPKELRTDDKVDKQELRRAATDGDMASNADLLNFQVYFYRRPLRVQKAFVNFKLADTEPVEKEEFSNFVTDRLQYNGDAARIYADLGETVDGRIHEVTWGCIKGLLERPWPIE